MINSYGTKVDGSLFVANDVLNWIRGGKIPDVYGGNRIVSSTVYVNLNELRVLTIENLSREDIEFSYGKLDTIEGLYQRNNEQNFIIKSLEAKITLRKQK